MESLDLEVIRRFLLTYPAPPKIKRLRLALFDRYRYEEDYESIYKLVMDIEDVNK
jgi:hypothetical protein